jgi:hypothetical protein
VKIAPAQSETMTAAIPNISTAFRMMIDVVLIWFSFPVMERIKRAPKANVESALEQRKTGYFTAASIATKTNSSAR